MKTFIAALLLSLPLFAAGKLEYLERDANGAAVVQHEGGRQTVNTGDEIPGHGKVKSVDDNSIHVVRETTQQERDALLARGLIPVMAEEYVVHRSDHRSVPITPR